MDMNWTLFFQFCGFLAFCAFFTWATFAMEQYLENENERLKQGPPPFI